MLVIDRLAAATEDMHVAKSRVAEQAALLHESSKNIASGSANLASLALSTALILLVFIPVVGFAIINKIMKPVVLSEQSLNDIANRKDLTVEPPEVAGEIGRILGGCFKSSQ